MKVGDQIEMEQSFEAYGSVQDGRELVAEQRAGSSGRAGKQIIRRVGPLVDQEHEDQTRYTQKHRGEPHLVVNDGAMEKRMMVDPPIRSIQRSEN
jgi:hypothetical protein